MTIEPPDSAAAASPSAQTGEYWSRKLQGNAFSAECCWRAIPLVHQRLVQQETSGGPWQDWVEYCVRHHLAGRTPVARMLTIGCGIGRLERQLAALDAFTTCDAWDIAQGAIETARSLAAQAGLSGIDYQVRDITTTELPAATWDAIWFENSLHHIAPLEAVCAAVARALKPDGWLFLNEYIGPPRFAFPRRQRELIRAAFALIPAGLRRHRETGAVLTSAAIPSPGEVMRDDPTEAVRSDEITRVVADHFDVVAFHPSGGSLLQFLLSGIAGNFREDDPESQRVIDLLLNLENDLRALGELGSDFAVIVARPKGAAGDQIVSLPRTSQSSLLDETDPTLSTLEEELSQRRLALEAAERYVHSLEAELTRRRAQEAELEGYIRSLESELAQKANHEETVSAYARRLEATIGVLQGKGRLSAEPRELQAERAVAKRPAPAAIAAQPGSPRVFAVIIHHRGQALLDHCLQRLAKTRGICLTTLVVANACAEPLPASALESSDLHVLRVETSLGFSAANNLAVAWARRHLTPPDHWFFLNNDTAVDPDTIQTLVAAVETTAHAGIAGPQLRIWGAERHLNSLGLNLTVVGEAWDEGIGQQVDGYGPLPKRREVLAVTGSALLVRDNVLAAVGGWNELYGYYMEDLDLCLQANARGWRVVHEPAAIALHAISATADQRRDFKRRLSWRNQLVLMLRHWPAGLLLRVAPRILASQLAVYVKRRRSGAANDARLQARAFLGALRLTPRALAQRFRSPRGDRSWIRFLLPAGSVPTITLPPLVPGHRPWETAAADAEAEAPMTDRREVTK